MINDIQNINQFPGFASKIINENGEIRGYIIGTCHFANEEMMKKLINLFNGLNQPVTHFACEYKATNEEKQALLERMAAMSKKEATEYLKTISSETKQLAIKALEDGYKKLNAEVYTKEHVANVKAMIQYFEKREPSEAEIQAKLKKDGWEDEVAKKNETDANNLRAAFPNENDYLMACIGVCDRANNMLDGLIYEMDGSLCAYFEAKKVEVIGLDEKDEHFKTSEKARAGAYYQKIKEFCESSDSDKVLEVSKKWYAKNLGVFSEIWMKSSNQKVLDIIKESGETVNLTSRNNTEANKIHELLKNDKNAFVVAALGMLHLPGKNGVLELLKAKGWKVEPVLLPA